MKRLQVVYRLQPPSLIVLLLDKALGQFTEVTPSRQLKGIFIEGVEHSREIALTRVR